ncbi:MAG: DUF3579 domain-containing protein [Rubrivivax sp.]|nr:MAG: DUF3579 domain-containing protein [Rubrivivax sp.]
MLRRTTFVADNDRAAATEITLEVVAPTAVRRQNRWLRLSIYPLHSCRKPNVSSPPARSTPKPREVFIMGLTKSGKTFRPSDWAERLAGAMSSFRPGGAQMGRSAHIGYSPYCVPTSLGEVKCVVVNEALRELEPMAWDFVMNFARDNDLQVTDACLLP